MQCGVTRGGVAALPEALCVEAALWRGVGANSKVRKWAAFPPRQVPGVLAPEWDSCPQRGSHGPCVYTRRSSPHSVVILRDVTIAISSAGLGVPRALTVPDSSVESQLLEQPTPVFSVDRMNARSVQM